MQQPRLAPLADLFEISRTHVSRVDQVQKLILVPNLICVAGAFLFGFTGLTAVMLSNLGTLGLYRRSADSLRGLDTSHAVAVGSTATGRLIRSPRMVTTEQIPDFAQLAQILIIEAERVLESARETETPPTAPEVTVSEVPADEVEAMTRRLEDLPKELGVLLTSVGVLGFVLPGIAGTPALIAGGLVSGPRPSVRWKPGSKVDSPSPIARACSRSAGSSTTWIGVIPSPRSRVPDRRDRRGQAPGGQHGRDGRATRGLPRSGRQ